VLVAGFQHETNTFAPSLADWAAFNAGHDFPAYQRGAKVVETFDGLNMPISGFIAAARERGWQLQPSVWAGATPSSYVTSEAFERIASAIAEDVQSALDGAELDAVYLDLHGAAVAQNAEDAEGELLSRLRSLVGEDVPIVASLDLHANVTERMLQCADALVSYRTYPHVDMADTGRLAAQLLAHRLGLGRRQALAWRRFPYLIPLNSQSTWLEPAKSLYQRLLALDGEHAPAQATLSFCMGFPAADFAECAPMIWAHADTQRAADAAADALFQAALPARQWDAGVLPAAEAVTRALSRAAVSGRPVVVADTQDNPGAGGDSNTTGLLHELLRQGAGHQFPGRVALGLVFDPVAALAAHQSGVGAELELSLGAAVRTFDGRLSDAPVKARFTVEQLGDGEVTLRGPMMTGVTVHLGPSAALRVEGIRVAVVSGKTQLLDQELLRALGIEPEQMALIVVKSSNHFRADFTPLVADPALDVIVAKAAGPMAADAADLPWTRLTVSPRLPV
jgi:microcystin degradation protein MlrC